MDFTAFDFETANEKRSSACSLGLAVVKNDEITEKHSFLIRPEPIVFNGFNTKIHGLTEKDVANSPTIAELWPDIRKYFENAVVVAHNASFDISVLHNSLDFYDISVPAMDIICTYRLSQAIFSSLGSYRLNIVCKKLGIELQHHDAVSDACGAANILLNALDGKKVNCIMDLEQCLPISTGHVRYGRGWQYSEWNNCYNPCRCACRDRKIQSLKKSDIDNIEMEYCDPDFHQKNFAFTGTLLSMPRSKAFEIVKKGGGIPQNGLTKTTDFLVMGIQDITRFTNGDKSAKMKKALDMRENGANICIIGEDEFLSLIDDELYSLCF